MSCTAWPGDLVAITGAGMGGGRRASVWARELLATPVWNSLPSDDDDHPSLAAFAPNPPATWPNGFLTCTQKAGYRALLHASASLPQRGIL